MFHIAIYTSLIVMIASTLMYIKKFFTSINCDTIMENDHAVKTNCVTISDHDNGTDHTYLVNVNTTLRFLKERFCEINGMKMEDICTWVDSYNTNSSIRLEDDDMTLEEYRLYNLATNHVFVVNMATDWPENIKAKKIFTIRITDNMTGE